MNIIVKDGYDYNASDISMAVLEYTVTGEMSKVNDKTLKTEDIDAVNKLIDAEEAQLALAEAEELQNKLDKLEAMIT